MFLEGAQPLPSPTGRAEKDFTGPSANGLDRTTALEALERLFPRVLNADGLRLVWLKHKRRSDLRMLFKGQSRVGPLAERPLYLFARTVPVVVGRQWTEQMNREFEPAIRSHPVLRAFGCAAAYCEAYDLLVEVFPAHRQLPFLVQATDPEFLAGALPSWLGCNSPLARVVPMVVQYKPERKCLLRYALDWSEAAAGPPQVFAKVYRKAERVYRNFQKLHHAWCNPYLELPKPVGVVSELCLELSSALPGTQLSRLYAHPAFPDYCRQVGQGLARLHGASVALSVVRDRASELAALRTWSEAFARRLPSRGGFIRYAAAELRRRLLGAHAFPLRPVHGDFHVANLLVHGGRLALLDFENLSMGHPGIDVGSFFAQIKLLSLKSYRRASVLDHAVRAFWAGYLEASDSTWRAGLATYCALSCLWCAYFQCLLKPVKPGWLERAQALLQTCGQILDASSLTETMMA